jgi:hypothetical protein
VLTPFFGKNRSKEIRKSDRRKIEYD